VTAPPPKIVPAPPPAAAAQAAAPSSVAPVRPAPRVDTVIPLIQPPDDPGPEPDKDESLGEAPQESWKRLRGLFK
jgi:hypothetical protein